MSAETIARCQHRNAEGKRCRSLVGVDHSSLCPYHAGWTEKKHDQPEDLTSELLGPLGDFRTAAAVNYTLGKLVTLVASRRISSREAATIGYLCQLLLQSIGGVNHEIYKTEVHKNGEHELRRILKETASLFEQKPAAVPQKQTA